MGEFANLANDDQAQSLEHLLAYETGQMSHEEAMDLGVIDEYGAIPTNITTWGCHDVHSLSGELDKCELAIRRATESPTPSKPPIQVWVSGGKVCNPFEMTDAHLRNAVKFANRNGIYGPAVDALELEIARRNSSSNQRQQMSRSRHNKTRRGYDYWSRRPHSGRGRGPDIKKMTHRKERAMSDQLIIKINKELQQDAQEKQPGVHDTSSRP